jgi:phenylpropionate dioxygenase-like ring-hydroxylating dioxygenase large terminal subunit
MTTALRTPHERAPVPDLGSAAIPKERYTSREYAELEWQRMWTRVWLCAGRESDAPQPGDYFSFEIGSESLLVIRQRDGSLAARYNVCTHRGNRLREPGRGHAEAFACLFHGWRFDIDGTLVAPLDPESFPQGCHGLDLRPVRCETWAGFVFVCLDPSAAPLREYLGVIPEHLDPYHFESWQLTFDCTIEIECNWKTSVDAFNEAYHLSATHAWTIEFSDDVKRELAQLKSRVEEKQESARQRDLIRMHETPLSCLPHQLFSKVWMRDVDERQRTLSHGFSMQIRHAILGHDVMNVSACRDHTCARFQQ